MDTWLIVVLVLYIAGLAAFIPAMIVEAPKHNEKIGFRHIMVALVWPAWAIWYIYHIALEKFGKN